MAEPLQPKIEHSILEKDIKRLSAEIHAGAPEKERTKEVLRAALEARFLPKSREVNLDQKGAAIAPPPSVLPAYLQKSSDQIKLSVEKLLDLAWHKGLMTGYKEAEKHGPFIEDAFHDALTDKLYEEFKKKGIIK